MQTLDSPPVGGYNGVRANNCLRFHACRSEVASMAKGEGMALSARQREILELLERYVMAYGYPPTMREVCAALGLSSTQTVYAHLRKLEQKGYVRLGGAHRAIRLLKGHSGAARDGGEGAFSRAGCVPLVGRVAAGEPLLALENIEGHLDLASIVGDPAVFALRVRGDSMVEMGIRDGDYILVRRQETAENGDIVVALLRDEATVKLFFREGEKIRLQPANRRMRPIVTKEVKLIGKVIASLRGYGSTSLVR